MFPDPAQKQPRIARDHGKYLHKSLGTLAPSVVAKSSEVYRVQRDPSDRLMNDRPQTDTDRVPIALLYHGFGRFLDALKGASTDHTHSSDRQMFEEKVDEFVGFMNEYYRDESIRNKKAVKSLNGIFECVLENYRMLMPAIVSGTCSSGHALSPTQGIEIILEVKNELSGTGTDPISELSSHYTQALKEEEHSLQGLLGCFSFPALGIVVIGLYRRTTYLICESITDVYIGSHIGFYALSFRERTRLVTLTLVLPTTSESGNDQVRPALLNAFEAACILRHHMYKDAKEFMDSVKRGPPLNDDQTKFPYITEVPTYSPGGDASASTIRFQIHDEAFQEGGRHMRVSRCGLCEGSTGVGVCCGGARWRRRGIGIGHGMVASAGAKVEEGNVEGGCCDRTRARKGRDVESDINMLGACATMGYENIRENERHGRQR